MTTIANILNAVPAPTGRNDSVETRAVLTSDFETFLKMLTAQAKFQDPLDPVSSSEYAAQLAQFSMVEQQVFTNEQLGALASQLNAGAMSDMAQWLGTEVASTGRVLFDGRPVELRFNAAETATRAQLVVEDETGRERARLDMPVSETSIQWDGNDASGAILPGGAYRFAIESFADGQLIARAFAKSFSRVVEVQRADGALLLTLENGATTSVDEVGTLRKSAS